MGARKTVAALVDSSYKPPGSTVPLYRIDEVEIPIITNSTKCAHKDTICPECAAEWRIEHLLTERLPWEHSK